MNVETALIRVGGDTLASSPNSRVLMMVINAYLPEEERVYPDTQGGEALRRVYAIADKEVQRQLLEKDVGIVRGRDAYRTTLLVVAGLLGLVVVTVALSVMVSDTGHSGAMTVLGKVVDGLFGFLGAVIGL